MSQEERNESKRQKYWLSTLTTKGFDGVKRELNNDLFTHFKSINRSCYRTINENEKEESKIIDTNVETNKDTSLKIKIG